MEIITDIEQGTPDWLSLRLGLITCSEIKTIRANGAGAQTYINGLAYERITGESAKVFAGNEWTERGHELEGVARDLYSVKTGRIVDQVSFIKNHGFGYSPDGIIGEAFGAIEIKSKQPAEQVKILRSGEIPKDHHDQLDGALLCGELEWVDFVSYCPNLPIFIKRVYANERAEQLENLKSLVEQYNAQIEEIVDQLMDMY